MENLLSLNWAMLVLLGFIAASVNGQATRVGFYSKTCPKVEQIVRSTVGKHFKSNPRVAPGLLRMHFHDCFVQGCDGSVLISGPGTERSAPQNSATPGYDVIDDAKTQLEAACPDVVSCADILALAARDSVVLTKGIDWKVPTGRRDGRVSLASEASTLPGFRDTIASHTRQFANKGLNVQDLVVLVGGHTIGTTSCGLIISRLYNFNTTTGADASIDPSFVATLRALCPQGGDSSTRVELDNKSGGRFDTSFFGNLKRGRGILDSDQKLFADASTKTLVQRLSGAAPTLNFNAEFAKSMIKMGNIDIKTGSQGEIRRVCSAVN